MKKSISVCLTAEQISRRVRELGADITKDYSSRLNGKPLIGVCILKGAFVFAADLVRHLDIPVEIDFVRLSSYGANTKSSGTVTMLHELSQPIEGCHVMLIEDIVDTGITLEFIRDHLQAKNPISLSICALLLKPDALQKNVRLDYLGFEVDNRYLVGYGLDANERHRNLPYIGYYEEPTEHRRSK